MTNTVKTHTAANYAALQRRHDAEARALDTKRKQYIKAIKTKQRQLGMDDATYRAMLQARTGKTSATACSLTELGNISGYLTAQGAVAPRAGARAATRRPVIADDRQALRAKVTMLLGDLVDEAGVTDSVAYVNAICSKNGWCSAVDFADAHILHKLVGALSNTLKARRAKNARQTAQA
ncbi:phage protein GemA/Gp16 family protein [Polaromonas sp.]|uniref:phage protein GemA/Gp16 family protein n=1 Tax=Polaromonas sp. TaxID=1869339 RepID=UPI003BB531C0